MWGRRRSDWGYGLLLCAAVAWAWVLSGRMGAVSAALVFVVIRAAEAQRPRVVPEVRVRLTDVLATLGDRCSIGLCITVRFPPNLMPTYDGVALLKKATSRRDIVLHTDFGYYTVFMRLDRYLSHAQCMKIVRRVAHSDRGQMPEAVGYSYGVNTAPSLLLKQAVSEMQRDQADAVAPLNGVYTPSRYGGRSQRIGFMQRDL